MHPDEVDEVQRVEVEAGQRFRAIRDPVIAACADHDPWPAGDLRDRAATGRVWVATLDAEIVGFVIVSVVDDCAHVEELAVVPSAGRRGIGTRLLDTVAGWAETAGLDGITLTTFRDVPWNRAYYERLGYRVLDEIDLTDAMQQKVVEEEGFGLPRELRCVMRREVATRPTVRDARAADLLAITRLFNALIPTTTIAWRDHLADADEMRNWFEEQQESASPVLVAEAAGAVVGYTTWAWFRGGPRFPGYQHTRELTIHVDGEHQGAGIGRALIEALVERARSSGVHVLVAGVDAENTASIDFHRALGFREVARMPEVGRKFDRWLDLVLMQRTID